MNLLSPVFVSISEKQRQFQASVSGYSRNFADSCFSGMEMKDSIFSENDW